MQRIVIFIFFYFELTFQIFAQKEAKKTIWDYFKMQQPHNWELIEKEKAIITKDIKNGLMVYKDLGTAPLLTISILGYNTKGRPQMMLQASEGCKGEVCVQVGFSVYDMRGLFNDITNEVLPKTQLDKLFEQYSYPFLEMPKKAHEPIKVYVHVLNPSVRTMKPLNEKKLVGELKYNFSKEIFELVQYK